MEREPVMTPRPMRAQRPSLERKEIWTLRRMRMGKAERKKSEMMDMTVWCGLSVMDGWNELWVSVGKETNELGR